MMRQATPRFHRKSGTGLTLIYTKRLHKLSGTLSTVCRHVDAYRWLHLSGYALAMIDCWEHRKESSKVSMLILKSIVLQVIAIQNFQCYHRISGTSLDLLNHLAEYWRWDLSLKLTLVVSAQYVEIVQSATVSTIKFTARSVKDPRFTSPPETCPSNLRQRDFINMFNIVTKVGFQLISLTFYHFKSSCIRYVIRKECTRKLAGKVLPSTLPHLAQSRIMGRRKYSVQRCLAIYQDPLYEYLPTQRIKSKFSEPRK